MQVVKITINNHKLEDRNLVQNDIYQSSIASYLLDKRWKYDACECGKNYYHKDDSARCGHSKCISPADPFDNMKSKARWVTPDEILNSYVTFFGNAGLTFLEPKNITSSKTTMLIGAGIQSLESSLYETEPIEAKRFYLVQPSIRAHSKDNIGVKKGVSTSFLSLGLQSLNPTSDEYVNDIDLWLNFLASIRFPLTSLHFFPRQKWDGGDFKGVSLTAYLGSLQIFDSVFVYKTPEKIVHPVETLSDIGSSLERMLWVINRTDKYFESFIGLLNQRELSEKNMDFLRTITLLSLNGVSPQNTGAGYIFRGLAKEYIANHGTLLIDALVKEHSDYWTILGKRDVPIASISKEINTELSRCAIQELLKRVDISSKNEKLSQDYANFVKTLLKNNPSLAIEVLKNEKK